MFDVALIQATNFGRESVTPLIDGRDHIRHDRRGSSTVHHRGNGLTTSNTQCKIAVVPAHWSMKKSWSVWCAESDFLSIARTRPHPTVPKLITSPGEITFCPAVSSSVAPLMFITKPWFYSLEQILVMPLFKTGWTLSQNHFQWQVAN